MIVMLCVDDNGGTMFNNRRQSRDRVLREEILALTAGRRLWMNGASVRLFGPEHAHRLTAAEDFLERAGAGEFCFVEGAPLAEYEDRLEQIILFKWNRTYPADRFFDIPLAGHGWRLTETRQFPGSSHEAITQEVYCK